MSSENENVAIKSEEFNSLMKKAVDELGISTELIASLQCVKLIKHDARPWSARGGIIISGVIFLALILIPTIVYTSVLYQLHVTQWLLDIYLGITGDTNTAHERCLVPITEEMQDPFRPPVNCYECANVTGVHRVRNLSHEDFIEKYAFTMQPVVIEDGQDGWTAGNKFSFDFFRQLYSEGSEALEKVTNACQFFPYRTEFSHLGEMLNMTKERAEGKEKPWYVGWSNCDGKAANTLRKHYKFPYFLPLSLDHSKTDWVFMGLPGYGAHMHIDAVGALSWQAQVRGMKKWMLESPPECSGICMSSMEIIVNPGDIIVLDTNKWFHATLIIGNETSIVIGSEYY